MPAFQAPVASSSKRKLDSQDEDQDSSRKRVNMIESSVLVDSISTNNIHQPTWMVQWRNPQYKKHKTWDGDAVLIVSDNLEAKLYDTDGKILAADKVSLPLFEGKSFFVGQKEIELERTIARETFLSGECFGHALYANASPTAPLYKKFNTPSFTSNTSTRVQQQREPIYPTSLTSLKNKERQHQAIHSAPPAHVEPTNDQPLHWTANWRKHQEKKNKTWDGDAYVSLVNSKLVMISEDGKIMGHATWKGQILCSGLQIQIGGKDIQLDSPVSVSNLPNPRALELDHPENEPPTQALQPTETPGKLQKFVAPVSNFYATPKSQLKKLKQALHDPSVPDSLVMKEPTKEHMKKFNKRNLPVVPVVIDPLLARKMRPHQREGLKFMYECVMSLRKHEGQGCILADEMGLGKSLQTIALIWTLLRQNPYAGPNPVVQKVLIVCPVSLVNNWKAEFYKWLGRDRLGILTCDKSNSNLHLFGTSKVYEVLIIGYERLRTVIDKLVNIYPPIGLIVCDEGHRLKSANNKTSSAFKAFDTRRRVILSGTPIQNDLGEFHAMAEFCNPGLLDDYSVFRKVYEAPILKSRAPDASEKDIEIGEARTAQLLSVAKSFVLRRDATLLRDHLPPKSEYVVFIVPTALQLSMYQKILQPNKVDDIIQSSTAESLALINILTKISNSPILLKATVDSAKGKSNDQAGAIKRTAIADALDLMPEKTHISDLTLSGKLMFLSMMLKLLRQNTDEKCVLVSHYTSTLNILEAYCKSKSYSYYRLDGQTPQAKRQEYVNAFNVGNQKNAFIFLLSSKAGGVGINLIGGSRLFLIDSDWNPSHDLQSMARCHRDGQKKPVYIYRMLTAGAIDEKYINDKLLNLLWATGHSESKSDSFTRKDLRDIFRIHPDTACNTHDLLECHCDNESEVDIALITSDSAEHDSDEEVQIPNGFVVASDITPGMTDGVDKAFLQKKKAALAALDHWNHINCLRTSGASDVHVEDDVLRRIISISRPKQGEGAQAKRPGLLESVDLDNIRTMDKVSIRNVPGGTISFIFEKCSGMEVNESAVTSH